ncbi:MAG: HindIII family type II restriction endonuclease [Clostridia bacterium]|nr:HindIII family type II restriction endonuclease [Clostridia bacterium]
MFSELLNKINELVSCDFGQASEIITDFIYTSDDFIGILKQIGTIPECIDHDSTQEKLFAKASDSVLSRALMEIGLKSTVLKERGDSADVQAESIYHGYTLVADAKAFRLSRTAKNQKDFKVTALSGWRKDAEYAVLCSPYFQYPMSRSQIYAQAVDENVCLFSWEHLIFLLENNIKETKDISLAPIWNVSGKYAEYCVVADKKNCFISTVNNTVLEIGGKEEADFNSFLQRCHINVIERAAEETIFWENELLKIQSFTREQAITELIKSKKIDEKITQIKKYTAGIKI